MANNENKFFEENSNIFFFFYFLSGCAQFKEKFNENDVMWANKNGEKKLILHNYIKDKSGLIQECDSLAKEALLFPDSKYFRDWINVYNSKWVWTSNPAKPAQKFIRYAKWQPNCIYSFNNIPSGNWIALVSMQHHVSPYRTYYGATPIGMGDISNVILQFAFVKVESENNVTNKDIVLEVNKIYWVQS